MALLFNRLGTRLLKTLRYLAIGIAITASITVQAVVANTQAELDTNRLWVAQNLLTATTPPPFSLTYNSVASSGSNLFSSFVRQVTVTNVLDVNRTQYIVEWTNTTDKLRVKCVAIEYFDYSVVEWTVYLTNAGVADTLILQDIQGLDMRFSRTGGPEFVLNGNHGDHNSVDSFKPIRTTLVPLSTNKYSPPNYSGRSCDEFAWPYYNLQVPNGGNILVIGWPGQWASSFARDNGANLQVKAGQQLTRLKLKPGEQIRTPLIVKMFWEGDDVVRAQNLWRHFYRDHVIPLVSNQPPPTMMQVQGGTSNQVNIARYNDVPPDMLWQDAGWYPCSNGIFSGPAGVLNTGTWEVNTNIFPGGFRQTSDAVRAVGAKFLLWFEPERIGNTNTAPGLASFLATNNPSWLLPATPDTAGIILNEGHPGAFNWLTNHIDMLIKTNGIDWYREDMNGNGPRTAWLNNDAVDRQGITENFYVQGHLAYWDALLAMNPGLRIDSCGAGGRRNDLEAMRRAVPLDRSDNEGIENNQNQTYGLASWLPYTGQGNSDVQSYNFRSVYVACFGPVSSQQAYEEGRKVAPIFVNGDYYPMTPYTQALDQWIGWQFDRPDTGEGFVQTFRRPSNAVPSMTFYLQGLNPAQVFEVQDFDKGDLGWHTGASLMTNGLVITMERSPQAAVIYYTNAVGLKFIETPTTLLLSQSNVQFITTAMTANGSTPTYSWDFGDSGTSTLQNPQHTYDSPGRYLAQVIASDSVGNSVTSQVPVTVMGTNVNQMKVAFSGYTKTETLTNFPALVVFGPNLSANGFSYSQMKSPNGWDLVFYNADRSQTLNYEIEKWDTNGSSYAWVLLPKLTNGTAIWAYWGDTDVAAAPAPSGTNGSVWVNGFGGVWHLTNGAVAIAKDSTANANNGAASSVTVNTGVVDGAGGFNGSSSVVNVGTNTTVGPPALTYSAWVRASSLANAYASVISKSEANSRLATLLVKSNGKLACYLGASAVLNYDGTGPNTLSASQWYYLTMTYDSVNGLKGYVNANLDGSVAAQGTVFMGSDPVWIGSHPSISGRVFNGTIDEARISTVARGTNWIWAEWMNMGSNSTFNAYNAVTNDSLRAPSDLAATPVSADQINLTWSTSTGPVGGYLIQRSTDEINWTIITGASASATGYTDQSGLSADTLYYYRLVATNAAQVSIGSVATARTSGRFDAWQYSSQIAFGNYSKSATLTNFPALVNISTNISGFAWSQFAQANNGYELRFADSSGNELPYEREQGTNIVWTNSAGVGQVWVRVPRLDSDTVITAYWGNPAQTNALPTYCTNGSVWANGFGGVWHLPNGQTLSAKDSTANLNDGTITSATATNGQINGAARFNGSTAYINVGTATTLNPSALTYSAWVYANGLTPAYSSLIAKSESGGRTAALLLKSNGKLACYIGASAPGQVNYDGTGSTTLSTGQWYYVTLAYDAANGLKGYVNGSLDGSAAGEGAITTGSDAVRLGAHPSISGRFFNGRIDEARISTVARDADWVWAEWMNMASNSVFNTYKPVVNGGFAAWKYKSPVTFNGFTKAVTLTNFPALVNIGTNITGFAWSQFASLNGYELRFADSDGTELPFERDRATNSIWTNAAGLGQVWVRVPLLNSNTVITAFWGNPARTNPIPAYCTNGAVWTNGFGGVWHLPDGVSLSSFDSTANKNNGTITGATAANGQIGGAGSFNGSADHMYVGNTATVNPSALTYSAWVNGDALANAYSSIVSKAEGGRIGTLLLKSNGKLACYVGTTGGTASYDGTGSATLSASQWYHVTMAYDSTSGLKAYVNGALDGSASASGAVTTGADLVWIGAHPSISGRGFDGLIDEARISTVARSAEWAWAEWMTTASNTVFGTYGIVTVNTPGFTAWNYSGRFRFSGYTKSKALTNFPALVNIGTNISGFAWSQFANPNGYELRFADSGGTELPFERDRGINSIWTNSAGFGQVWVRVPYLNSNTVITAYWGNRAQTNAIPAYCTNGAVWANGFGGVWHLPDGLGLSAFDSTSNKNDGAISGAMAANGKIDGAGLFDGAIDHIYVGNTATVNPAALTYSAWVNADAFANAYSTPISKAEGGRIGTLLIKSTGKLACYVGTTGGTVSYDGTGSNTLSAGQWYHVTMAYDSVNGLKSYVNGTLDGLAAANGAVTTGADMVWIGAHPSISGRAFDGVIDEARISTVARDANWAWAEWMNVASNSVFICYGGSSGGNGIPHGLLAALSPYELWRRANFTSEQLANPAISGDMAGPSGDGLGNFIKYALGLNPWATNAAAAPMLGEWTDPATQLRYLTLTYRQNMQATDVAFIPQATPALNGAPWAEGLPEIAREVTADCDIVTVRDVQPMTEVDQRFLRLLIGQ